MTGTTGTIGTVGNPHSPCSHLNMKPPISAQSFPQHLGALRLTPIRYLNHT
jgi:hypothetical protein